MWLARTVTVLLVGVVCWWHGEEGARGVLFPRIPLMDFATLLVAGLLVLLGIGGGGAVGRLACGLLAVAAAWGGIGGGLHAKDAAVSDCQERGEAIREALARYREENGTFPAGLADLPAGAVSGCGRRPLRGTILVYERQSADEYDVQFGVEDGTYFADEDSSFFFSGN